MTQSEVPLQKRRLQSMLYRLLIGLLIMQGIILLAFVPATAYLREQIAWKEQQNLQVDTAVQKINTFIEEKSHQLEVVGSLPVTDLQKNPALIGNLMNNQTSLKEMVRLSSGGEVLVSWTSPTSAGNPAGTGWFEKVGRQNLTGTMILPSGGDASLLILALPAGGGETMAALVDFSPVWDQIVRTSDDGGQTYVLDGSGLVLAHPDPAQAGKIINPGDRLPLNLASTWHGTFHNGDGKAVIGSAANLDGLDWMVVSEISVSRAFRVTWIALGITVFLVLAISAVILLLYRGLMLRWLVHPLLTLKQAAREMGTGDLSHRIPEQPVMEINEISVSMNEMAERLASRQAELEQKSTAMEAEMEDRLRVEKELQDNQRHLEQRVNDRTIELTIANEMLQQEIDDRRNAQSQLLYQMQHEPLTDLPNRSLLIQTLDSLLKPADLSEIVTPQAGQVIILCMDINHFQVVNDSLGHPAGDRLLLEAGRRLQSCLRPGEMLFHLGADEFVVLIPDTLDMKHATRLADHLMQQIAIPFDLEGHEVYITTSVGIAASRPGEKDGINLLRDADTAMYRAKAVGANRYEIFSERMHARARKLLKLEAQVRRAVLRSEFQVYYQPIVTARNRDVVSFEGLIRWKHPQQGFLLPGDFLPLASEAGLMHVIDNWVLEAAAAQSQDWSFSGLPEIPIAVNISSQRMMDPGLPDMIQELLTQHSLPPRALHLEITESSAMENINSSLQTITNLRMLGVQCWLDDFGQEYSSLSYLSYLPVAAIKIPSIFIRDVERNKAILRAIIQMAHALNLRVCAEGVETETQANFLAENNCDVWQGFLYSPPLPVKSLVELMKRDE